MFCAIVPATRLTSSEIGTTKFSTHSIPLGTVHDAAASVTAQYAFERLGSDTSLMDLYPSNLLVLKVVSVSQGTGRNVLELEG